MQLAEEYEMLDNWHIVRNFAYDLFGLGAYSVTVYLGSFYNDEYYVDEVDHTVVQTEEGKEAMLDFSTPFWQLFFKNNPKAQPEVTNYHVERAIRERWQELPIQQRKWVVLEQPQVSHPLVFVHVNDTD
jgi:hypothetical protein